MATTKAWLSIIGIGEERRPALSPIAERLLANAELVIGGTRHLALAAPLSMKTLSWPTPLTDAIPHILAHRGRPVCILASGDPFHYGIGATLSGHLSPNEYVCLPAPSAFSLAASRLGWPLASTGCLTAHGRPLETVIPHLQRHARLLILSWDGSTPHQLAELITKLGFGPSRIVILEAMGGPRERIREARAESFDLEAIDPLNTIGVEVIPGPDARILPLASGLDDAWFETDGQLTKREIRTATLSKLSPGRGELLWDIGAGSGSVGIEWMLCHPDNRAVAIEARTERAHRIARNAASLGTPGLRIVEGVAPEALHSLPAPDAIFIGGGATRDGVMETAWASLKPGGRLVANAVTIETEAVLMAHFQTLGGSLTRLHISHADPIGGFHGWRTAMPVTQWSCVKR